MTGWISLAHFARLELPRGAVGVLGSRILAAGLSFLIAIVTAHLLGVEGRGEFFTLVTLGQLAAQIGTFGLQSSNVFVHARDTGSSGSLVLGSGVISILSGSIAAAVCVAVASQSGVAGGAILGHPWIVAGIAGFAICSTFVQIASPILIAEHRMYAANALAISVPAVGLLAILLVALVDRSPEIAFVANALGAVAGALVLLSLSRTMGQGTLVSHGVARVLSGSSFALRTFCITSLGWLAQRGAVFVLGTASSAHEVGLFSIAMQVTDALMLLPGAVGSVLYPQLLRAGSERDVMFRRTFRATVLIMVAGCIATGLASAPLLPLVFGAEFSGAVPVLAAMLPATVLLGAITVVSQDIAASGQPLSSAFPWAIGALVAFGLCAWLAPGMGAVGAALGQCAGLFIVLLLLESIRRAKSA